MDLSIHWISSQFLDLLNYKMSSNLEVDFHIRHNYSWTKLPASVKQSFGNSQNEYEKAIVSFSIKNQLRYRGNLVSKVHPTEQRYYEEVLSYSQAKLLLYPYHLSDMMVQGLRATPFHYYLCILDTIMEAERSYDSLPNFTAADCLRLLGIGRNEYIELMNQARSGRKLFRRKPARSLLPQSPLTIPVEPWWIVQLGCIMEEDIKIVKPEEKKLIDLIIDKEKGQKAGILDLPVVHSLYKKGLIYLDVPIEDSDYVVVPPLEGFVMNRVLGDYFETLLYKIFVSIDEHTSVGELASVLQIDTDSVKSAVSLYCRLGFARKKNRDNDMNKLHPSWHQYANSPKTDSGRRVSEELRSEPEMMLELNATPVNDPGLPTPCVEAKPLLGTVTDEDSTFLEPIGSQQRTKRIAFLFDSTLTAFLMMGNLSPGLKSHAVTMFEVGKLADESLGSLLSELERVQAGVEGGEGEAQRYFDHALILRHTIRALRANPELGSLNLPLDLVRCESLQSLDPVACARLLNKNYSLLVSMAPLCKEIRPVSSCSPPHLGPALPEVNSVWFKLFLYHLTGRGPPSLLITKAQVWQYNPFAPFGPVVERRDQTLPPFLPDTPANMLARGEVAHVPWITGVTKSEGVYPAGQFVMDPSQMSRLWRDFDQLAPFLLDYNRTVSPELRDSVSSKIRDHYLGDTKETDQDAPDKVIKMVKDRMFAVDAQRAAEMQARFAPVWFYHFTYRGAHSLSDLLTGTTRNFGTSHADDVSYFMNVTYIPDEVERQGHEKQVELQMLQLWTSFASSGEPRYGGGPLWEPVTFGGELEYLEIDGAPAHMTSTRDLGDATFWESLPLQETSQSPALAARAIKDEL